MTTTSATSAACAGAGGAFPSRGRATTNAVFPIWLAGRGLAPRAVYRLHNRGAAFPAVLAASRR